MSCHLARPDRTPMRRGRRSGERPAAGRSHSLRQLPDDLDQSTDAVRPGREHECPYKFRRVVLGRGRRCVRSSQTGGDCARATAVVPPLAGTVLARGATSFPRSCNRRHEALTSTEVSDRANPLPTRTHCPTVQGHATRRGDPSSWARAWARVISVPVRVGGWVVAVCGVGWYRGVAVGIMERDLAVRVTGDGPTAFVN